MRRAKLKAETRRGRCSSCGSWSARNDWVWTSPGNREPFCVRNRCNVDARKRESRARQLTLDFEEVRNAS
jgi:hypothetical protein